MLSKSTSRNSALDPLLNVALAGTAIITLASATAWYFMTDHSMRETAGIVSAVGLASGLGLLGLTALRSLIETRRTP